MKPQFILLILVGCSVGYISAYTATQSNEDYHQASDVTEFPPETQGTTTEDVSEPTHKEENHYNLWLIGNELSSGRYNVVVVDGEISMLKDEYEEFPVSTPEPDPLETLTKELMDQHTKTFLKFKNQLYLRSLQNLLPKLDEIRTNLSLLLQQPSSDANSYNSSSDILERNLDHVEGKLIVETGVVHNMTALPHLMLKTLAEIHAEMTDTLENHSKTLGSQSSILQSRQLRMTPTSTPIPSTTTENSIAKARQYLDDKFPVTLGPATADGVVSFLETLPEDALVDAYRYLFTKISAQNETEDSVTPRAVAALQEHPEVLAELMSLIPSVVTNLFTSNPKCMKMRSANSYLVLSRSSILNTESSTTCEIWKFGIVEDGKYVTIKTMNGNGSPVGIGQSTESFHGNAYKSDAVSFGSSIEVDLPFLWRVVLVNSNGNYYLKFVNAKNGYVLDADGKGPVYVHMYNFGVHQHWLLQ